jgi:hypothetical protein
MAVKTVRDILVADSAVTSLVGQRISPVLTAQDTTLPYVILTRVSLAPMNNITDPPSLDSNRVQVDSFSETYAQARQVADACRAALEASNVTMESEFDNFEPDVSEYRVTQDFLVWT